MANRDVPKKKGPKEALLKLLEKNPPIYADAVKYTLYCWNGFSLASLLKTLDPKVDRASFLNELQKIGFIKVVNNPKTGLEDMAKLTEKGRDDIINVFYSGKERRKLRRLIRSFEGALRNAEKMPH